MTVSAGQADIVLATLNARYTHASLGLRYLRANLGPWRERSQILEFVIHQRSEDVVERILASAPRLVGFGVYIWNVRETTRIVAILKRLRPDLCIVLGGPEVSYETQQQEIVQLADHVITGWGDVSFAECVQAYFTGQPLAKVIPGKQPPLAELTLPYDEFTSDDLRHRVLYVEASRGCPFKCEFCLSALDKTAWPFPLEPFLEALESLYQRGARRFKFVDRTFNLKVDTSLRILEFFAKKLHLAPEASVSAGSGSEVAGHKAVDPPLFIHLELVPDHLPERLKEAIAAFPAGSLQFEIGIQTFNPDVQQRISRKQDDAKAAANIAWLRRSTKAHLHVDLIAGLPGETVDSFAEGFDRLVALAPHEIQFGILKRLRGTPIIRHTEAFGLIFNPEPPYNVLATADIDFESMQRMVRFARYWDLLANSGRFPRTLPRILGERPFARMLAVSDWLYRELGQTHEIAHERLVYAVHRYLTGESAPTDERSSAPAVATHDPASIAADLIHDYQQSGGRAHLRFDVKAAASPHRAKTSTPKRQTRHLQTVDEQAS